MGMVTRIRSYNTLGGKDHRGSGLRGQHWPKRADLASENKPAEPQPQVLGVLTSHLNTSPCGDKRWSVSRCAAGGLFVHDMTWQEVRHE